MATRTKMYSYTKTVSASGSLVYSLSSDDLKLTGDQNFSNFKVNAYVDGITNPSFISCGNSGVTLGAWYPDRSLISYNSSKGTANISIRNASSAPKNVKLSLAIQYTDGTYNITTVVTGGVNAETPGIITPNSYYVYPGDTVTLNAHPYSKSPGVREHDYILHSIVSEQAQITMTGENVGIFTMPVKNVTVTANFQAVLDNKSIGYYDGTEFIPCIVNYYDGTDFVECEPFYYDGSDWVECNNS